METLLNSISDKIMETGILTKHIERGHLAIVGLEIDGDEDAFSVIIKLTIDDRDSDEVTDDEWDSITEEVGRYFREKQFWALLAEHGFSEQNSDGFDVVIELG
jgi:hypothetical protein